MTNFSQRLDEILGEFVDGCDCRIDEGQAYLHQSEFAADKAKQAILRWAVQILEETKEQLPTSEQLTTKYGYHMPEKMYGYKLGIYDAREAIDQFEQNLLKALEVTNGY